ncbi:MAG: hypothetical protein OXH07_10525 [Chloroflexi bacterium]|nr:hypothetical protein [Chloroflexota bacterium]
MVPLPLLCAIAGLVGSAMYYCWPQGRQTMLRNYAHVLPEATVRERQRIARQSLANYLRYMVEFAASGNLSPEQRLAVGVDTPGFDGVDRGMERGRGVVVAPMHFGNWDLAATNAAARGYKLTVVGETFGNPRLDDLVVGGREALGVRLVKMEKVGPSLVRSLRRNEMVATLIDRPLHEGGVRVRFFGEEVEVPAGPARLALHTGAAIGAVAFPRRGPGRIDVLANFDLGFEPTGDTAQDVQALTQAIMTAHETFVRDHPEQWYMFREFWEAHTSDEPSKGP